MACERETEEVTNAEASFDGAALGFDQAVAVFKQAGLRLAQAIKDLLACKQRQQAPGVQVAELMETITQNFDSMKVSFCNTAQQAINDALAAPCPTTEPEGL